MRFGGVFQSGFDWEKSAKEGCVGQLGEVVRDKKNFEVFVVRVKDERTIADRARTRAGLVEGAELMVRYW